MIDRRLKASEVRDTACSLHISPTTILSELKEKAVVPALVNIALLCTLNPEKVTVGLEYTGEAEMDEDVVVCRQPRESTLAMAYH